MHNGNSTEADSYRAHGVHSEGSVEAGSFRASGTCGIFRDKVGSRLSYTRGLGRETCITREEKENAGIEALAQFKLIDRNHEMKIITNITSF